MRIFNNAEVLFPKPLELLRNFPFKKIQTDDVYKNHRIIKIDDL